MPINKILIAPGIYRESQSLVAEARIGSSRDGTQQRRRQSFPLGTKLEKMQAWQYQMKSDLLLTAPTLPAWGSLAEDVTTFLETLPAGSYKRDSGQLLAHWAASPLGFVPRSVITRVDVIAQIARWQEAGAAKGSCNLRLSRLRKLFHTLDGVMAPNPTDKVKYLREDEREPRDMSIRIVNLIVDSLPDLGRATKGVRRPTVSETKIRLRVMAWTGMTPSTLQRVRPRDLDLAAGRIHLPQRRKGGRVESAWVQLLPPAVEALRDFAAAGLLGKTWAQSSMRKRWKVGIARAKKAAERLAAETGDKSWSAELDQLPANSRPYDLRHSFASEIYRQTGDIRAVSELLQHADLETTKRYTNGAVSARVTAAIEAAGAAYAAAVPPRRALRLVGPAS